jgi:hypothetical protein
VLQDSSVSRTLSVGYPKLLYRLPRGSSWADSSEMKKEVDSLMKVLNPRKRLHTSKSIDELDFSMPTKRLKKTPPNLPSFKTEPSDHDITEVLSDTDPSDISSSPTPFRPPAPRITKPTAAPKPLRLAVKKEDGTSSPAAAAVASSSGHGKWPLKYVQSMSEGFRKMSTMKGTLHHRFGSSFNTAFPGSNATYHDNEDIWNNAPKHLKDKYIRAGFTDAGLWKDFRKEVKAGFPDGRAPRKRSKNGAHAKKEAMGDVGIGAYFKEEDAEACLVIELLD